MADMERAARLREARELRYGDARAACAAHGFVYPTYMNHEGGFRDFAKHVPAYAKAFRVNTAWLLTGEGPRDRLAPKDAEKERQYEQFLRFQRWQAEHEKT